MESSRAINHRGVERVRTLLSLLGAQVEPTGTMEVHLVARYPGALAEVAIAVKATMGTRPGGGQGRLALDWWIKDAIPADQVALVDLMADRVWLFTMEELRALAQQHSDGRHHVFMVVEPQENSKHTRYLVEHFAEYLVSDQLPDALREPIAHAQPRAALDETVAALEGEIRTRMVRHRLRERELRESKLAEAKRRSTDERLRCEVPGCGFDFEAVYGELGRGYAPVHHLLPLSGTEGTRTTTLADLAVVCANCHAMIHRSGACRPISDLVAQ